MTPGTEAPRGRHRSLGPCNGWDGKAIFVARCAQAGCQNTAETAPCSAVEVPKQLRLMGWTKTGATTNARWWCMVHRQEGGK